MISSSLSHDTRSVSPRETAREVFLQRSGWGGCRIEALAADASTRAYYRAVRGPVHGVLMDAPPAAETSACPPDADEPTRIALGYNATARLAGGDNTRFAAIAAWLISRGLSAPEVYAADFDQGFLLLEDLGDGLFARLIERGTAELPLYDAATDLLAELHGATPPKALPVIPDADKPDVPLMSYDALAMRVEIDLLADWYLEAAGGPGVSQSARDDLHAAWDTVLPQLTDLPPVLVMRDYHAENLLWLPERRGAARVGLLDFQDAVTGHPAYDLVSLLTDARRTVSRDLNDTMRGRYLARSAQLGRPLHEADFTRDCAILGVQRNTKILGIFARLWQRDGKPGYLKHIPRVWEYVEHDLQAPALAPVRAWFDAHIPPSARADALLRRFTDTSS